MAVVTTWTVHHRCGHDQDHDLSKKPPSLCGTRRKGQLEASGSRKNNSNSKISKGVVKCHLTHCDKNLIMRTTN
jgi:hypothetical protein